MELNKSQQHALAALNNLCTYSQLEVLEALYKPYIEAEVNYSDVTEVIDIKAAILQIYLISKNT